MKTKLTVEEFKALAKQREAAGLPAPTIICSRSTYTQKNADNFRPFFLEWERTGEAVVASYLDAGCFNNNPSTTKRKAVDALNWIINNDCETASEKERWQRIRVRVDIVPLDDGIIIQTKPTKSRGAATRLAFSAETRASSNWKQAVFDYLDIAGKDTPPFVLKGLTLTGDDMEFIKTLANQHGFLSKVSAMEINLLKA